MKRIAYLDLLLVALPAALLAEYVFHLSEAWVFILSCVSIVPLAKWLGVATEHIAEHAGSNVGGLLNATFGNAAELIIAAVALNRGLFDVVKASLTGSIIGNVLLVMGASFVIGGMRHNVQHFNVPAVRAQGSMLMLAAIALVIPAVFHTLAAPDAGMFSVPALSVERNLSFDISCILLIVYLCSLVFSLKTHKTLFNPTAQHEVAKAIHISTWTMKRSLVVLVVSTVCIAWMSELLVDSVQAAALSFGMSGVFVGVIIVAIVGNAAEHSTAVIMAVRNRMDLSIGIAVGSGTQIALFVAPLLVLLSYAIAPQPLDLVFTMPEVISVALSVLIAGQITGDGQSNWFEGAQLLAVYLILAVMFYFLPAPAIPG